MNLSCIYEYFLFVKFLLYSVFYEIDEIDLISFDSLKPTF